MVKLLSSLALGCLLLGAGAPSIAAGRQQWALDVDLGYAAAQTPLTAWPEGGLGKLRYGDDATGLNADRILLDYRARLTDALQARATLDYVDDASAGAGVTEAYLEWRPIPTSRSIHRWRFGAFYPPFSLENAGDGWSNPYFIASSAIDTWLGEEIRTFGAEWSLQRPLWTANSPQRLKLFAAGFYGNDPAGTLLFWRGWALHDRQTRFADRLPLPPRPQFGPAGAVVGYVPQSLHPFTETDHRPGAYAGAEWHYRRRALLRLAAYDNRALPTSFAGGQWGWHTRFSLLAAQLALPWNVGLIAQRLDGSAEWIVATTPDGMTTAASREVYDRFDSAFLMLTKRFDAQRIAMRYERFSYTRPGRQPALRADRGSAWAVSYRYELSPSLSIAAEWLRIDSARDIWSAFYDLPVRARERQFRVQLGWHVGRPQ